MPAGFTGKAQIGAYYYGDDDEFTAKTENTFAFRHATLGLSHALGETGANWSLDYILVAMIVLKSNKRTRLCWDWLTLSNNNKNQSDL